ncbi:hypothetical protein ACLVWU_13900 [Bdellovibrio sp. HCB290]|uniref:hypothetical protein n=1 Tax=Bdellovibrio sp. HCB290 TaxID=3394356 RepID=UPI0039B37142
MKSIVLLIVILISSLASARSTEFGNGGNAMDCPTKNIAMYDVFEAEARYSMKPVFPPRESRDCTSKYNGQPEFCPTTGTVTAKIIVSRLKNIDPKVEAILQKFIDDFWKEATLTYNEILTVNDTGLGLIGRKCTLKQLAIQHEPLFEEDSRYFISRLMWENMWPEDRAALIVHEVLYRLALQMDPETNSSEKIRYFNALLLSDKISTLSSEKYDEIKRKVFLTIRKPYGN